MHPEDFGISTNRWSWFPSNWFTNSVLAVKVARFGSESVTQLTVECLVQFAPESAGVFWSMLCLPSVCFRRKLRRRALKICASVRAILTPCLLLFATTLFAAAPEGQVVEDFNSGPKPSWKIKKFQGATQYSITDLDGEKVMMAFSNKAASAIVFKREYSLHDFPVLSWRWKVRNVISKGDYQSQGGDDYAARVYVIFPHRFFPWTRSINYVWANRMPKGSHSPSPYTARSVMVAMQTGPENTGSWITERRNVREDYRRIFGEEPPAVGGIAIMTDTDDTGGSALAWYDDIRIEKE